MLIYVNKAIVNEPCDTVNRFEVQDDILAEQEDILLYREWIASHNDLKEVLVDELEKACKYNYINRCSVVCDIIQENGRLDIAQAPFVQSDGRSLLHLACFSNSTAVACHLISMKGKELVARACVKGPHKGATPLHIACLLGNQTIVSAMLESLTQEHRQILLHSKASGSFYDQNLGISGLPLNIAVWSGHKELCTVLIKQGAQLDMKDEDSGQTVLHTIVTKGRNCPDVAMDMIKWLLSTRGGYLWWCMKSDQNIIASSYQLTEYHKYILKLSDKTGLTPLVYAGKVGVPELIEYLLQIEGVYRFTVWTSVQASHVQYDVREIDPSIYSGLNKSLLEYLTYMNNSKALKVLTQEPLRSLVSFKWKSYKYFFLLFLLVHFSVMVIFSSAIITQPISERGKEETVKQRNTRFTAESVLFAVAILYTMSEILDIIASAKDWYYIPELPWKNVCKPDIFRVVSWIFCLSTFLAFVLRAAGHKEEDIVLAISITAGWYMMLGFTRMFQATGFFTSIVHRVLTHEICRLAIIMVIFLVGFSSGVYLLFRRTDATLPAESAKFELLLTTMFTTMLGLQDFQIPFNSAWPVICTIYLIAFIFLATLTMLYILIASTMDTYRHVKNNQEKLLMRNRLLFVLAAERRLFKPCLSYIRSSYLEYSTKLNIWLFSVEQVNKIKQDDSE